MSALDAATGPNRWRSQGWRFHSRKGKPKRYAVDASGNYRMTFGFREQDAIEVDPDVEEVARILVRGERRGKAVRINITLDEGLIAAIDRVAENRSGFLADAARAALAARREGAGT